MKIPKLDINFYKVAAGVCFSLIWGRVMYCIWDQPSYITFLWFYLCIGSILLKWFIFKIIDKIDTNIRLKLIKRELEQSAIRVMEASKNIDISQEQQSSSNQKIHADLQKNVEHLQKNLPLGDMVEKTNYDRGLENKDKSH